MERQIMGSIRRSRQKFLDNGNLIVPVKAGPFEIETSHHWARSAGRIIRAGKKVRIYPKNLD